MCLIVKQRNIQSIEISLVSEKCFKQSFQRIFCFTGLDILKRFFELDMHVFALALSMEKLFLQLDILFAVFIR